MKKNSKVLSTLASIAFLVSSQVVPVGAEDMSWPSEDDSVAGGKPVTGEVNQNEEDDGPKAAASAGSLGRARAGELKMEKPQVDKASAPAPEGRAKKPVTLKASTKQIMLYGRLDQIASEADVKMPVLKAETAQLDPRGTTLKSGARKTTFTGSVARSFPVDFSGTWGGKLAVWRYNSSSLSDRIDPNESARMAQILTHGKTGTSNFVFRQQGSSIELEPAVVRMLIPAQDSYSYKKVLSSNQLGGMGSMVKGMMANMKIPVILHFGQVSTGGSAEVGVSGNQIDQTVVKNVIRQLAPRVLEEQIVTRNRSVVAGTGQVKSGYTETVLRFTRQSPSDLYVLAASVDYTDKGAFLRKLIMYGTVVRGQVMNVSPVPDGMGGMGGLAGGAGGAGGLSSMAGLSSMISAMTGGQGGGAAGGQNYGALMRSLQQGGYGGSASSGGSYGNRANGFSQVMKSLNMLSR